ncbi:MAG: GNAT family N-acetyltransferase [Pseudomonadota bacterium]
MIGIEPPVLETERLTLRGPEAGDAAAMSDFLGSERARWHGGPFAPGQAWRVMATQIGHWVIRRYGSFVLVEKASGRAIGLAGPWHPGDWPEPEFAWSLWSVEHEGRGLMAEAMGRIARYAWADLGWRTAVSYIDPRNTRSAALAARLGATPDPIAARPAPQDGAPDCIVWRHPHPRERAA